MAELAALDASYADFWATAAPNANASSQQLSEKWRKFACAIPQESPHLTLECLDRALKLAPIRHVDYLLALLELGTVHLQLFSTTGDSDEVRRALDYLKRASRLGGSIWQRCRARLQLSVAYNAIGLHRPALKFAQEAERLVGEEESSNGSREGTELLELRMMALHNCCACHEHLGQHDLALLEVRRALDYAKQATHSGTSLSLCLELAAVEASVSARQRRRSPVSGATRRALTARTASRAARSPRAEPRSARAAYR